MFCDFKRSTEKWDSEYMKERRKSSATKARTEEKLKLTTSTSRCLYEKKNNILAKWLFFISKRRQKTGIASKLLGQHSTNIDKSWHRKLTCWDTDFGFSTQWYHPRWITHLELGPIQKSMKEWFNATQRKMLRFIIQTKKKYKKIEKRKDKTNENDDTENLGSTEDQKWGWTRFRHVLW